MTRWAGVCTRFLLVFLLLTPFVAPNSPLKFFRMYIKNSLTNEVKNCFPRDWSMDGLLDVSKVYNNYGDRANFLFGFDGPEDLEVHDCTGVTPMNLDVDAWGCDLDLIRDATAEGQAIWQVKYDVGLCNTENSFVPDHSVLSEFFKEREAGNSKLSSNTFALTVVETKAGNFMRHQSKFSQSFGPTSFFANKLEIHLYFRHSKNEFRIQVNIPVRHYNYCAGVQPCLEAIYAGMNAPPWICPQDRCPPGYRIYKQDRCYRSLVNKLVVTPENQSYRMSQPVNKNYVETFGGTRDCLNTGVDPKFCYSRVQTLIKNCFNYPAQNFATP